MKNKEFVPLIERDLRRWGKRATRRVLSGIKKWGVIFTQFATSTKG